MTDKINIAVGTEQLEVAVIRRKPLIQNIRYLNARSTDHQCSRRLLTLMAGIAFHTNRECGVVRVCLVQ